MNHRLSHASIVGVHLAAGLFLACSAGSAGPPGDGAGTGGTAGTGGSGPAAGNAGSSAGSSGGGGLPSTGLAGNPDAGAPAGSGGLGTAGRGGSGRGGGSAAAGRGGSAGTGSAGTGSAGTGTGGAGSATTPKPSAGCNTATTQAVNQWVQSMVTSGGAQRPYSVRLPTGYDPARAYPVIVLLHGCGSGTNNVPMENATGTDAILVRGTGSASGTCWDTAANGPDVAFFDAMVTDTKTRFCADEHRFFVVGYSSGSWLVNQLTCIRADVLRGAATVTGGESAGRTCGGPVSRIFIHDSDDTTNVISGSITARDRQLKQNGCDTSMQPVAIDPQPCVNYPGCPVSYPVEWCQTSGQMHNRQDSLAPKTFWGFFKQF